MNQLSADLRRSLILLALMLSASFAAYGLIPSKFLADTRDLIDLEAAIPKSVGDWKVDPSVTPVSVSPGQQEVIDQIYTQIVSRTYVSSAGHRVMLSVAYGSAQTRQMRAHRQEVCYAAQGFQIHGITHEMLRVAGADVSVTRMVAVQNGRSEPVTYWFTMGDSVVRSYLDRQLAQLRYAFSGFIPDGYLFRVSSLSKDTNSAFGEQAAFAELLVRSMDSRLAEKLIGNKPI